MRIAELESRTGLSRHALRFYEREGLLVGVSRGPNNYREYPESAVKDTTLLQQLQSLGFSLQEIRDVLGAMRANSINCAQGASLLAEKRAAVEVQIANLRKVSKVLMREQHRLLERAKRHAESAGQDESQVKRDRFSDLSTEQSGGADQPV